jgi:exopolysaccharide biosynthesis polyprenyl glycosylphosphotransferase
MQRRTDDAAGLLNLAQVFIDAGACALGFVIAVYYRNADTLLILKRMFAHTGHDVLPLATTYYTIAGVYIAMVVVTFAIKNLYHTRETGLMNMDEATGVLHGLFVASMLVVAGNYILINPQTTQVSRLIVGLGVAVGNLFVLAGRALGFKIRRYLQTRGHFFRRVVICGAGEAGRIIARKLLHSPKFHILPVAFLDAQPSGHPQEIECLSGYDAIPVAGTLSQINETLEKYRAHEVWIAMPTADQDLIAEVAQVAGQAGAVCRFVPNLFKIPLDTLAVESVGGVPLLAIKPRATVRPMPFSKRAFDVVFSLLVLIASAPLWPLLMLLVKNTSKGSAFFAQERIGQGGRPFTMYKFRTMYADAPAYAHTPRHSGDQRITPLGRWLRKLSLDELPQFWNVLIGDMSVVGPRPEMPQIVAEYNAVQRQRLCVKPGITGVWQISADRKNPIHENIDYDLYYIEKQSFFLDLMIILTTGFYGARGV